MKLQAGNPNLMKINKSVGLGTFAQTAGDRGLSKVRRGYVPIERDPSLVPAPAMSVWKQPVYVAEKVQPMRPGADDHLKFKSVGNLT
tara:strand:+ start:370 stop:630 length:261 start_codon:yes stop_codon:yes gene_type:complete